jgi:hypothetical protein
VIHPGPHGDRRKFGGASARAVFSRLLSDQGWRVAWIVRLVQIGADGDEPFADVMTINRPDGLDDIANLGLTVADGKQVLAGLQQEIVAAQARNHSVQRPECRSCSGVCHLRTTGTMQSRRILAKSRCDFPAFAVLGVARSRLALVGHRIAGRRRNSTNFKRIFRP